ncbi:MAG: DUF2490 domain-containing protein [Sphingobacteriales bacterium]|nr:DUF2490 domain-containing protein [Sphingobacteriales bacterium]
MIRFVILAGCLFLVVTAGFTQGRQIEKKQQVWLGYFNQTRLSAKWGIWLDAHIRTREDFFTGFSQGILRLGLTRYLSDDLKLTAGYAFVNHFPAENHKHVSQPEHRPWQQLQWHTRYPRLRLMQWLRLEERWRRKILNDEALADGYLFNFRVRYNFFSQIPLSGKKFQPGTLSFVLNDEVHINFGKQIVYNYFDQNRLFAGFNYHLNKHDNLQFGYMYIFQQLAAGNRYRGIEALRLFYFHHPDWRKK